MKFKYTARNRDGELQAGYVESFSKEGAANILTGHELFILSLENADKVALIEQIARLFKRVTLSDLMIFTRQFSILMESKVPLVDSLKNLEKQTRSVAFQEIIAEIIIDIESGLSLSQSFERQGEIFSEFYISIIKSAEITGHLEDALSYLADHIEKEKMWKSKILNAMIYPLFLFAGFIAVVILMVTVVFPKIQPIFSDYGVDLPWYTKFILGFGGFLLQWWWAVILILIPLAVLFIDYFKTNEGKVVIDELTMKLPIVGDLMKKMYISRFAESLMVLIKGAIPISQALEITGHSIGSYIYRDLLIEIAEEVRAGQLLSNSLKDRDQYFFPVVSQMIAVGESTGRLEEIMLRISNLYTRETEDIIARLSELIQPIVIAIIGVFIGILFSSILIPIFNMMQSVKM